MRFDIGLPLLEKVELDQFYVDSNSEQFIRYKTWLDSPRSGPLMITGQIGSGKTTFIHYGCINSKIDPDIRIKFDSQPVLHTSGGFTALALAETLKWILKWGAGPGSVLMPEIKKLTPEILDPDFITLLTAKRLISHERRKQREILNTISLNQDLFLDQIDELINQVDYNFHKDILIFAEGVDKLQPSSPEYIELEPILNILKRHKTLFETNLVHYFTPSEIWGRDIKKLIIPAVEKSQISDCLTKRVGQFYIVYKNDIETIADLSGGNYRQAVRLFSEFEFASSNLKKSKTEAINYAVDRTFDNFLSFSSVSFDLQVLGILHRDKFITSGVAQKNIDLIFNNFILIESELSDSRWKCAVNPLLIKNLEQHNPSGPTLDLLKDRDASAGAATTGLSNRTFHNKDQLMEYLSGFKTIPLNISETFTALSSLFLSDFNEIVIILYKNREVAEIANDYFLGNVGNVTDLKFSKTKQLKKIDDILSLKDGYDESTFFIESYDKQFLQKLDQLRDWLITKNMLWWVKQDKIMKCLNLWPQLRQFLKIYSLDESIRSFITIKEIEDDLSALKEMGYNEKNYSSFKIRLEKVLNYLKKGGNGNE